jgi:predicted nucleotidyltransferase
MKPFFEDCYERISVRKYSKLIKVSPPTASKILKKYEKEGLLEESQFERYLFFNARRSNKDFLDLSRLYWRYQLSEILALIEKRLVTEPAVVLFGSLSKAEVKKTSDIDIAIVGTKKNATVISAAELSEFEKRLGRKIEIFEFESLPNLAELPLFKAVLNGYILMNTL